MENEFTWDIDVKDLLERRPFVKLETTDGMYRRGQLTNVITKTLDFMGRDIVIPLEVELNNDSESRYPLDRLKSLTETDEAHAKSV